MELLKKKFNEVGIECDKRQLLAFQEYHDLLLSWSEKTNLVSRTDLLNIEQRHFLESVAVLPAVVIKPGSFVVDVGSGAGFPALPVALIRKDVNFTLVESKKRKSLFLKQVVSRLKLSNVSVVGERCEVFADNNQLGEKFDFVFSRAVGRLEVIYGWVQKIMKKDCIFVAWKGGDVDSEINHFVSKYGNKKINVKKMDDRLVDSKKNRSLVLIQ